MKPNLFLVRSQSLSLPNELPFFHGKEKTLAVGQGRRPPTGLIAWRTRADAEKDLTLFVKITGAVLGYDGRAYEVVEMQARAR